MIWTVSILLLIGLLLVTYDNLLYGLWFLVLLIIPLLILFILNLIVKNEIVKELKSNVENILAVLLKVFFIIAFIALMIVYFIFKEMDKQIFKFFCYESFYYSFMIFYFVILNYLGTKSVYIRYNLEKLIKSLNKFFSDNFILNIFIFLILFILKILFKNNDGLFLGILGSYIFFALTEINTFYKVEKRKIETNEIIFQVILNGFMLFVASDLEQLLINAYLGESLSFMFFLNSVIHMFSLGLIFWFSNHIEWIKKLL